MNVDITDKRVETAIKYLASTDESHARERANYHALEQLRKTVRAQCFGDAKGGVKEREMAAECDPIYIEHIERIKQAEFEFHHTHNKRKLAELTVEMYRTMSANQRKGNI